MKHFAALLLLTAAAALSGLDIDLHKYRVRQGKYEFTKEGEDKMVKIYSLPKVRSCYVTFDVPLQPFHKYELSFEMRGENITRRPSKSLFGGGVTFNAQGRIIYRGSQHGMWKHALGTFDWQKVVIKFKAPNTKESYFCCEIADADGWVEFRRARLVDVTGEKEKKAADKTAENINKAFKPVNVSGKVFDDANGNGKMDPGEKGIAGVQVSDGLNIVKTDAAGVYSIAGATGKFLFAVKPDNGVFTGRHYAPLADKTDFAVKMHAPRKKAVFYSVNDSECGAADPFINQIIAASKEMPGDFLAHCGDIGNMKGHLDSMTRAGMPVHYAIGNHDFYKDPAGGEAKFERLFGPMYYSFNVAGLHCIVVGFLGGVDAPPSAQLAKRQLEWFKKDLALNPGPKVIFRHHPMRFSDAIAKMVLDPKNNFVASVSGHTHAAQTRLINGVITTECAPPQMAAVDHSPRGFIRGVWENGKISFSLINPVSWTSKAAVDKSAEPVQPGADWAQFRRSADRNGIADTKIKMPLKLRWKFKAPGYIWASSPVVCNGRVFAATLDDSMAKNACVIALDVKSGKLLWKTVVGTSVKHTPAVDSKRVYAAAVDGTVFALDVNNGKILWKTSAAYFAKTDGLYGPVTLYENRLFAGGDHLVELDPATGKILREDDKRNHGSPCHAGAVIADGKIFSSENWRYGVFAHSLDLSKRLWNTGRENGVYTFLDSGPIYADGKLYQKVRTGVRMIDPATGKCLAENKNGLKRPTMETFSLPLAAGGKVFFGSARGLFAHDAGTLAPVWSFTPKKEMVTSVPYSWFPMAAVHASPAFADGKIIFGGGDGFLYVLDSATGKVLFSKELGASVYSSSAITGNAVITSAADGTIYAFTGSK